MNLNESADINIQKQNDISAKNHYDQVSTKSQSFIR